MKQQLVQQTTLERKLNQSLIQSMQVLQFSSTELIEYIEEIAKENPLIEEVIYDGEAFSGSYNATESGFIEGTQASEKSLYDRLKEQLLSIHLSDDLLTIVEFGIDSLDESGYLDISLEEWKEACNTTLPMVEEALRKIQELEPRGVGARNLGECLYLQVRKMEGYKPEMKELLLHHIDWIADQNYEAMRETFFMDETEISAMMSLIQACDPKPGLELTANDAEYIIPEAKIYKEEAVWKISFTFWRKPRLVINSFYQEMKEKEAKAFLDKKKKEINWLQDAITYREATIERVIRKIVEHQLDFFEHGLFYLQAMTLKDIAKELDVHLSTVSRAISNKFVETPHGVFPLKFFFQSGIQQGKRKSAAAAIKQIIYRMIEKEDKQKPLSDERIKNKLQNEYQLAISRRTVMKYRQSLKIPASYQRKEVEIMKVIFYTKESCSLCDEVESTLAMLQADYPHTLEKRDIYSNDAWLEEYHLVIPVIEVNGEQLNAEEITFDRVKELLDKHKVRD